jgi:hypothetical protein
MTKLATLVGLALFALSACAPIGAATREPAPTPSGRAAATPSAAQSPAAETDDLATYRRTAQVLASKDIAQVTTIDFAHFNFHFDITELFAEEGKRFGLPASSS